MLGAGKALRCAQQHVLSRTLVKVSFQEEDMNANNNADSPSSVQGSVSSGQKKRKRKANKETQSQLAVRSNSPYSAVPINTYEKFLNLFMVKMNSNIAESLNELKYHYIDKCHFVIRHYNRSDYSKPAPTNPIGAPNYIEMTGVDDYHGSISRYLEAMPDYTIIFSDMTIQTLHTKTILMAKCSQQSTLISHIPVPKTMQLDHAIDALALNAKNELQDVRVASEDMDTIRKLVLQVGSVWCK
ncbi:hypothetical protein EON65_31675 [archaeon]|nr:MAG: hypothetical protein EON65_31675 [archaeon]